MPKRVRSALVGGLSCAVRIGDTLWTACDETCHVERLQPLPGTTAYAQRWGRHTRFALADYLPLAIAPRRRDPLAAPEADLEGLAYRDGYLWVLGSHARARGEADRATTVENLRAVATIERDGNRYLLARIPVIVDRAGIALARKTGKGRGRRTAACVRNDGTNLLILAGPTMANSGLFSVFRWRGGARIGGASLIRGNRLEKLLDLPDDGSNDHPEGIAAWPAIGRGHARLLVVYERAAKHRRRGPGAVLADVYAL
jgi:hypothetical protein